MYAKTTYLMFIVRQSVFMLNIGKTHDHIWSKHLWDEEMGLRQCYLFSICNLDAYYTLWNSSVCTLMIYECSICIYMLFKVLFYKELKISYNWGDDQGLPEDTQLMERWGFKARMKPKCIMLSSAEIDNSVSKNKS